MFFGYLTETLQFLAVAKVATVSEARNDILVFVHSLIDGSTPDSGTLRQCFLHHLDTLWSGNDATEVNLLGFARL